jgi:hypothetical protein
MMFARHEGGRLFLRSVFGHSTQQAAVAAAKRLWYLGHAVRVERGWWRWHVWRSV